MRVSTVHVRALVEAFEGYGMQSGELLAVSALRDDVLRSGYGFIDVAELDTLTLAALSLTGDQAFGLHWGERAEIIQFDLASLVVAAAPTLRSGLEVLSRFQPALGDRPEFRYDEGEEVARMYFEPLAVDQAAVRVRAELAVTGFWRLLESIDMQGAASACAYFAYPAPSHHAEYARLFSGRVQFEHAFSGIEFPRAVLDRPLVLRNESVYRALSQEASHVRSRVLAESSLRERVKLELLRTLPAVPEMPSVASAVGLSERSLRRRLEDEGSTFSQLIEEARLDRSRELLADHQRPIKQVAGALGFADVRSFHRAFKRWTGLTPVAFRSQR